MNISFGGNYVLKFNTEQGARIFENNIEKRNDILDDNNNYIKVTKDKNTVHYMSNWGPEEDCSIIFDEFPIKVIGETYENINKAFEKAAQELDLTV